MKKANKINKGNPERETKMGLDLTMMRDANEHSQRNRKANEYRNSVAKRKEDKKENIGLIVFFLCLIIALVALAKVSAKATDRLEDKYAGYDYQKTMETLYCNNNSTREITGEVVILTDDGNIYSVEDAPEIYLGAKVNVTFNANGTEDVTDDIFIAAEEIE